MRRDYLQYLGDKMKKDAVILDCYTDEPSGYGVRPYIGSHQINLSQALSYKSITHKYLTIDDLRFSNEAHAANETNIRILNTTKNKHQAHEIIANAGIIYIVMGCFVDYNYFSAVPPKSNEIYELLKNSKAKKILFYVMGSATEISPEYSSSKLKNIIDHVETGNTYRYILESTNSNLILSNYEQLGKVTGHETPILNQLDYPVIAEIETGIGCNTPTCSFCIESKKKIRIDYREPSDIIKQVKTLYDQGVRHFRLGRQPNFYHYQWGNSEKLSELLYGIRTACPNLITLHIDNANMIDVIKPEGIKFTKIISDYCTSGNIAPFGVESFDEKVRLINRVIGSPDQVIKAIEILNEYGSEKGADGQPKLLPGINLIHDLNGQTERTHEKNLSYLEKILSLGLHTRRLYYRQVTNSTGVSFSQDNKSTKYYEKCFDEITNNFVIPMQYEVFPKNSVLSGFREVIYRGNCNQLRTLGTCSLKVNIKNSKPLKPYGHYSINVLEHTGPNTLDGTLV